MKFRGVGERAVSLLDLLRPPSGHFCGVCPPSRCLRAASLARAIELYPMFLRLADHSLEFIFTKIYSLLWLFSMTFQQTRARVHAGLLVFSLASALGILDSFCKFYIDRPVRQFRLGFVREIK